MVQHGAEQPSHGCVRSCLKKESRPLPDSNDIHLPSRRKARPPCIEIPSVKMLGLLGIEEGLNQAALIFGGVAGGVLAAGGLRRAPEARASIVIERSQGLGPRAVGAVEPL